jgi:hypothetical protein
MSGKKEPRDFAELVTDLRNGNTHQELSLAYQQATEAAKRTGKTATITFTVKIKPNGDKQCEVIDSITKKIPEPSRGSTIMFVDENDNLTRTLRQMNLSDIITTNDDAKGDLVEIDRKTGELRAVE